MSLLMRRRALLMQSAYSVGGYTPSLVADFINESYTANNLPTTFSSLITHARASTATKEGSDGLTVSVGSGVARQGHHIYDGSSWVNKGLRLEKQSRTNLEANSQNPTTGAAGNVNVTWNSGASDIFGGTTAHTMLGDTTNSNHYRAFNNAGISFVNGTSYSLTVVMTAVGSQQYAGLILPFSFFPDTDRVAIFDLINGTVTSVGSAALAYIIPLGAGRWACTITSTCIKSGTVANSYIVTLANSPTSTAGYVGSTSDGVIADAFQMETLLTPSSHIPTSGATATRAAETMSIAAADLTYNSSAMWFSLSGLITYSDINTVAQITLFDWFVDANNRIRIYTDTSGAKVGDITLNVVSGGTSWNVTTPYLSPGRDVPFNIAWRVTDSEINLAVGGTAATVNTSVTSIPNLSSANVSMDNDGVFSLLRQGVGDIGDAGIEEASI